MINSAKIVSMIRTIYMVHSANVTVLKETTKHDHLTVSTVKNAG